MKADRRRDDWTPHPLRHGGHDRARVHPAAQKRPHRDIAPQPDTHRLFEPRSELIDGRRDCCARVRCGRGNRNVPVSLYRDPPGVADQKMTGLEFADLPEDGRISRDVEKAQVRVQSFEVHRPLDTLILQDRLQL